MVYGPRVDEGKGVIRGWPPGMAERRRSVSMMIAWRRGRASISLGAGTLFLKPGPNFRPGVRVRSSARRRRWRGRLSEM